MNRRGFLGTLVGGVAAAAAVRTFPFRVFSFPTAVKPVEPIQHVRFIRAFDPLQSRMVNRWDVLYGFGLLDTTPLGAELVITGKTVQDVLGTLNFYPDAQAHAYNELQRRQAENKRLGFSFK